MKFLKTSTFEVVNYNFRYNNLTLWLDDVGVFAFYSYYEEYCVDIGRLKLAQIF